MSLNCYCFVLFLFLILFLFIICFRVVIYAVLHCRAGFFMHTEYWVDDIGFYENRFDWDCETEIPISEDVDVAVGILRHHHYDALRDIP